MPRLTPQEVEARLLKHGFVTARSRSKGSYVKSTKRIVVHFYAGKTLHPKIVRQVLKAIEMEED